MPKDGVQRQCRTADRGDHQRVLDGPEPRRSAGDPEDGHNVRRKAAKDRDRRGSEAVAKQPVPAKRICWDLERHDNLLVGQVAVCATAKRSFLIQIRRSPLLNADNHCPQPVTLLTRPGVHQNDEKKA